jgi:glyoxylate/hydroxypyruvate reductase A
MPKSAILLAVDGPQAADYRRIFEKQFIGCELRLWPDHIGDAADIAYACIWRAPHGLLARFPNLKVIFNLGAGADHVLADPALPDVPLVRAANPNLSMRVTEYCVLHTLMFHRRQRLYDRQQHERIWKGHEQPAASDVALGVMGLGVIGAHAAGVLARIGFKVAGWSASRKDIPGIETFAGTGELDAFLARTEILIVLLPSTPSTEGILNLSLLRKLKRDGAAVGAFLINAGRGKLQVDADILAALDEGALAGAALDVFPHEPLPPESLLWAHPKVTLTPHNAGDISPQAIVADISRQIARFENGEPLDHLVRRERGY